MQITELWKNSKTKNEPLLSNYSAEFWSDYRTNFPRYDRLFSRMFGVFAPVHNGTNVEMVQTDFTEDVYTFLMVNDKRFTELYRIHIVTDQDDPLTYNYDMRETMARTTGSNDNNVTGAQTTTNNVGARTDVTGAQNGTTVNKVSPEDSESFYNQNQNTQTVNERTDTTGAQTSTQENGARTDTHTGSGTENYTLTRVGNIGTQTATDMLDKHNRFWCAWAFYEMIFKEIIREFCVLDADDYYTAVMNSVSNDIYAELKTIETKIDNIHVDVDFTEINNNITSAKSEIIGDIRGDITNATADIKADISGVANGKY